MDRLILVIDDEKDIRDLLVRMFEYEGYNVLAADCGRKGLEMLRNQNVLVVISDIKLPDISGIKLTNEIKEISPETEVICLTAYGTIQDGVQAMKNGAFDYLVKGDDNSKIIPLVSRAIEKALLQYRIKELERKVSEKFSFDRIIGQSPLILESIRMGRKVAGSEATVLLAGPTGTGKEIFAQSIHTESPRRNQSFVAVNCSAFGRDLLESELFGYKAGAFTGAVKDKRGLFEEAHKGTIFLDEIGELNLDLQAKLLRVLEGGAFIKLGDTRESRVNVRVIAATNRNLEKEVENGQFRDDLYYRLSVFTIQLPSLNERTEDLPELTRHFIQQFSVKANKKVSGADKTFLDALKQHNWKGNIRELRNVIERSVILAEGHTLTADSLGFTFTSQPGGIQSGIFKLKDIEKKHIENVLTYCKGNKTKAAELLDIAVTTLYNKLRQ